jgi:hypothetical protein
MSISDKQMNMILILVIIIYLAVLVTGLWKHELVNYCSFLNAATGAAIIVYWVQKQIGITQHIVEAREIAVLCLEGLIAGMAIYAIFASPTPYWLKIMQYIIFGVHLSLLVLFLVFMLTFKMKKLF